MLHGSMIGGLALLALTPAIVGQMKFTPAQPVQAPSNFSLVYRSANQTVIAVADGLRTLEWDGTRWTEVAAPMTNAGFRPVSAYDQARDVVVTITANSSPVGTRTWEWDGTTWTHRGFVAGLDRRQSPALAYDPVRQVTVLYGGSVWNSPGNHDDTWEYDGTTWTQVSSTVTPGGRGGHAMAYDPIRGEIVMFGGTGNGGLPNSTWAWNGINWTQRLAIATPPGRGSTVMAFDQSRGTVVMFGGFDNDLSFPQQDDTWEWNGLTWTEILPATRPPGRGDAGMAFDAAHGEIILWGGTDGRVQQGWDPYTWRLNGGNWLRYAHTPPDRGLPAMTYYPPTQSIVLHGGSAFPDQLDDTWVWDGSTWTEVATPPGLVKRYGHQVAYDPVRQVAVLFGGADGAVEFGDTWEWDGSTWTQRTPATRPFPRNSHAMAWDPVRRTILLYGGNNSGRRDDLWEWDGTDWSQIVPPQTPPAKAGHTMATDLARNRVVLFGDDDSVTWEWDGTTWIENATATRPPTNFRDHMTWDAARNRVVLGNYDYDGTDWVLRSPTGGNVPVDQPTAFFEPTRQVVGWTDAANASTSDLWKYEPITPAVYTPFGTGCPSSAGTPTLGPAPNTLPWLGDSFSLEMSGLPPGNFAFLFFGTSSTTWGGFPLPLDMSFLGMFGCSLWVSPDLALPLVNVDGTATLSFPIQDDPALLGAEFFNQGGVSDPGINAQNWVGSNGIRAVLGSR